MISIFCIRGQTGIVQISGVFLALSSKTNARARQDLYDSKQYRFCPQAPLQSTQNESSSKGLKNAEKTNQKFFVFKKQ